MKQKQAIRITYRLERTFHGERSHRPEAVFLMTVKTSTTIQYPGLLADLAGDTLLKLKAGERLWKLYFLRPASDRDEQVEHRIYTKEQVDGRIGLASYTFRPAPGGATPRTNLAYAKDIPEEALNQLIWNVVRQIKLRPEELEIIDLTEMADVAEQLDFLQEICSQ